MIMPHANLPEQQRLRQQADVIVFRDRSVLAMTVSQRRPAPGATIPGYAGRGERPATPGAAAPPAEYVRGLKGKNRGPVLVGVDVVSPRGAPHHDARRRRSCVPDLPQTGTVGCRERCSRRPSLPGRNSGVFTRLRRIRDYRSGRSDGRVPHRREGSTSGAPAPILFPSGQTAPPGPCGSRRHPANAPDLRHLLAATGGAS